MIRPVVRNDAIPERAIDDVVSPTVKALGNGAHGFLAERYEIRIAPHETDEFPVGRYLQQIARQQRAFVAGALRPVHRRAAFEVTADADERETRRYFLGLLRPQLETRSGSHDPALVGGVQMDRNAAKRRAPIHHRRVIVRMRNRNRLESAKRLDDFNGRIVDQADAVPQHVAVRRAHQ